MSQPLAKNFLQSLRPGDGFILLLFLALAAGSFRMGNFVRAKEKIAKDGIAVVTVGNHQVASVNLATPADFAVHGALGEMTLRVENDGIRVLHSLCPNQVCVRQGAMRRAGEMLVCVPNRLVVLIRGNSAPPSSGQTPAEDRGDAVTY
jgi:hypothetical protein